MVVLYVFLLCFLGFAACSQYERSLNGPGWLVQDTGGRVKEFINATVPGQVHLDLMRAGIIEDPYENWNDWLYQWVGYSNWTYHLDSVDISSEDAGKTIWLKCDGLDTIATVRVNSRIVGHADNYHRRYKFDISDIVQVGSNKIQIDFKSGANYSWEKAAAYPYDLYTDVQGVFFNKSQRGFIRKTQSDFGWDWGPGLVPCGIIRNISLVVFEQVYVDEVVPKTLYDTEAGAYFLSITVCVQATALAKLPLRVSHTSKATGLADVTGTFLVRSVGETCNTTLSGKIAETAVEPMYWFPRGVSWKHPKGSPNLVQVDTEVTVLTSSSAAISSVRSSKKVGFRRIEMVQEKTKYNDTSGLTFYFQMRMGDVKYPFYSKGSNFIPMDAFVNRPTVESTRKLLTAFVDGNQNMLRVWGGGLYQPDWFYDLCDEMGIMVWQEFMYADALYPRDTVFLRNVEAEIRDVVRRLGHHPSIVLWSGNNENQGLLGEDTMRIVDYTVLYDEIIRTTLWEEDTTRLYWPSSPSNGVLVDDREAGMFIQRWGDVSNPFFGDLHRYDYNDYCMDVSKFPKPRFVSEFGFQSYPSSTSIKSVSRYEDWKNDSPFMNHRNHHPTGNKQMQTLIAMVFKLPVNDDPEYEFVDFVYLSQVMQGLCIRAQAEHYRRMLSDEQALTRGTLYWQLNDIWQAQTWSSVEWSGQWKILHFFMRRVYAPLLVSAYQDQDSLHVYVVLDVSDHQIAYTLHVDVVSWENGQTVNNIAVPGLLIEGFKSVEIYHEKMDAVFKGSTPKESFLLLYLTANSDSSEVLATNWHFPANFTEVDLPDVVLNASSFEINSTVTPNVVTFNITSTAVAPFVYLENTCDYGVFSDNGFLMLPNIPVKISFTAEKLDLATFKKGLTMRSIKDTYTNKPYEFCRSEGKPVTKKFTRYNKGEI